MSGKDSCFVLSLSCHANLEGHPDGFKDCLKMPKTGSFRTVVTARAEDGEAPDNGKRPVFPKLCHALAEICFTESSKSPSLLFASFFSLGQIHFPWVTRSMGSVTTHFAQQKGDQVGLVPSAMKPLQSNHMHTVCLVNSPHNQPLPTFGFGSGTQLQTVCGGIPAQVVP